MSDNQPKKTNIDIGIALGVCNTAGLVLISYYFYKRCNDLQADIINLKQKQEKTNSIIEYLLENAAKMDGLSSITKDLSEEIEEMRENAENDQHVDMEDFIVMLKQMGCITDTLNENDIEVDTSQICDLEEKLNINKRKSKKGKPNNKVKNNKSKDSRRLDRSEVDTVPTTPINSRDIMNRVRNVNVRSNS